MISPKKKIIYVITKSNWGGAQKYVYDLSTSLPMDAYEPVVVFGGNGALAQKLKDASIRTVSLSSLERDISFKGDIQSFFGLLSVFRDEKPDIIHVNSSKVGGLGGLAGRIAGVKKIVFTCHGWPWNEERSFFSLWAIRVLSWMTVMFSHETIAVSARDLHEGRKMPFSKNKIKLVHNGVKEPDFKNRQEALAKITEMAREKGVDLTKGQYVIGAIGELHKNKGYEYFIRAIKELPLNVTALIMGEGEEKARLEKLISLLGLEKRVALLGFVKEAPTYAKAFDVFALTSVKEGLPYVVIEAGYASLPVVSTNVGGVKEIIDDMKSGVLVQRKKPEEISQAIFMIINNRERGIEFGENLNKKIKEDFSLSKMIRETLRIYQN